MARLTPRRRMWTAVGIVAAITSLTVGAWGLRMWAPFAHVRAAVTWPKNVQPLVDFVQGETQLRFRTAVTVRFVPDPIEFRALLAPLPRTVATTARLAADAALGRALGYWSGDVDLGAAADTVRNASDFAAAYVHSTNTLIVGTSDSNAVLTPLQRADLIVSLVEILDDQQYDVVDHLRATTTSQQFEALAGVDLGQAVWLHDRYIGRFNTADRQAYDTASTKRSTSFTTKTARTPPVFRALRVVGQRVGLGFVAALHATQPDGLAAAFTTGAPSALDQMEMPASKFTRRDTTNRVDPPAVPVDAHLIGHRQLGPFGIYLLLSTGLPPTEALTASDGWGNDAVTVFRAGTQICANGRIVADTTADADRIERGLNAWGHARPKETGALIGRKGDTVLFSACDPGPKVEQPPVATIALDQFFGRADELDRQITSHSLPNRSECVAVSAYSRYLARDLNPTILDNITSDCDSSI